VGGIAVVFSAAVAAVAAAAVTIDAPSGWKALDTSSMSIKYEAAWAQPGTATDEFAQNITLLKQDLPGTSFDDYVKLNEQQLHAMDSNMTVSDTREPCSGGTMLHLKYATTIGTKNVAIEQVLVQDGTTFYVGTYARLVKQPDLPEASQALKSICSHLTAPKASS
jgi:hypothetical protein